MPNPARQAIGIDVNAANNAAASAGTMNSTRVRESACASGAAMMPIAPANAEAATVLTSESSFGDRPASMPYTSFSAAARVAKPKRVQRYKAVSASAISTTIAAIQNLFAWIDVPETLTKLVGKMLGICFDREPNHSRIVACKVNKSPSEDTSLASGDDVRSGRKTFFNDTATTEIYTRIV